MRPILVTPRLEIDIDRLASNARSILAECAASGIHVAAVTKGMMAHPGLLAALAEAGVEMLADSRIDNLRRIAQARLGLPTMLLRSPGPGDAAAAVRWADYSLTSCPDTIRALAAAAQAAGRPHRIMVMTDVGDLREGVWPDRLVQVVSQAATLPGIEVVGIGTNLACYGGVLPTAENMTRLVDLREECRAATGLELPLLSGGNSANLPLLASGHMPEQINQLRIGEAILLGRETATHTSWPGTRQDAVRLVAQVIEVESKPSIPIGPRGQDAFSHEPTFADRGTRRRAICALGRQDIDPEALTPQDPGIIVLGASSDHLILDVDDAQTRISVGSEIAFWPWYGTLLRACTSPLVTKITMPRIS